MTGHLSIYYDFASPFCYAACAIVQRLRQQWDLVVDWLPFEVIDYLPPRGAMPQNPAFVRRGEAARARALAQEYGLTLHLRERLLNSNLALCAVEAARDLDGRAGLVPERLVGALFAAYFAEERDISDLDVVLSVAAQVGIDARAIQPGLRQGLYRERVAKSRATAYDLGVVAVPTWLSGGSGVVGVPAYAEIERLLTAAEGEDARQ
jgi:predicted DsbA family dithiol-disulfide isomerase